MTTAPVSRSEAPDPVTDARDVDDIADAIDEAGSFALDLEFMTEGRYVAELSLVQVGWGGDGFCYDNEQPRHRAHLEPFRISKELVR